MKIRNIEKQAKKLGYEVKRTETPFKGIYTKENLIGVKGSIENSKYYMTWEATAEEGESLDQLDTYSIALNNKNDPSDVMTDYFTCVFFETIKGAFECFTNK